MSAPFVLAVPSKGRLQENAEAFFARAGLELVKPRGAREYRGAIAGLPGVEVAYLSASDITTQLGLGAVHFGVTGEDQIREAFTDAETRVVLIDKLGFGEANVVVAVPQAWIDVRTMADLDDVATAFRVTHDRKKDIGNNEDVTVGKNRTESVGANESITISKNRTESVGDDESVAVGKNQTLSVGKNQSISVAGNRTLSVDKDESITITGKREDQVGKDEEVTIGKNRKVAVAENDGLSVGKKLLIEASDEIVLQSGDASVTIKKDGTNTARTQSIASRRGTCTSLLASNTATARPRPSAR